MILPRSGLHLTKAALGAGSIESIAPDGTIAAHRQKDKEQSDRHCGIAPLLPLDIRETQNQGSAHHVCKAAASACHNPHLACCVAFFLSTTKWTPTVGPLIHTSSQRRNANPVDDRIKKNSRDVKTSVEPSTSSRAPVDDTSLMMQ